MEIVPTVEFPPAVPFTSQLTAVLLVPETPALNCCVCFTCTVALVGEIDTEIDGAAAIEMLALAEAVV